MINLKIRLKNPVFIAQVLLAILTPILAYAGITAADITSWRTLWDLILGAVSNPYVLSLVVVSVWNAVNDPTTEGINDSAYILEKDTEYDIDDMAIENEPDLTDPEVMQVTEE